VEIQNISDFLNAAELYCPELKPQLTEKLILTRMQLPNQLFSQLHFAWRNTSYTDVTLIVADVSFQVHKAIICSRSTFFRALCFGGLRESGKDIITLTESNPQVFSAVLEYMYTNSIELTDEIQTLVVPILIAANSYAVVGCKELMEDLIGSNLDLDNVLSLLIVADNQHAHRLLQSCTDFIQNNLTPIFTSHEYHEQKSRIDRILGSDFCEKSKTQKKEEEKMEVEEDSEPPEPKDPFEVFLMRHPEYERIAQFLRNNNGQVQEVGDMEDEDEDEEDGDEEDENSEEDGSNNEDSI